MNPKTAATVDDLYLVPGKAELVGGEIVMMSPTGGIPAEVALRIGASLLRYTERTKTGHAVGDNAGFVVDLPDRKSFSPDAAYFVGHSSMKFIDGAPAFAVEVRSEGDYGPAAEEEMAGKRADYFTAGTQVVWDVDLQSPDAVRVYRSGDPDHPTIYRRGQLAEAEPAVPEWTMPVDDLFPA
ncbi:MAG TPA: Uma2 family endonuclease [Pirellulales bacterium]|jgi:Uma2 family endonuclease|nr:Uma2 family endonuclease [Pirellulales bacterium]